MTAGSHRAPPADLDRLIGRLLTIGTYAAVLLIAIGTVLMFASRIDPLAGGPPFEPGLIVDDITHARPVGFIWLGLLVLLATPIARVIVSFFGYVARRGADDGHRRCADPGGDRREHRPRQRRSLTPPMDVLILIAALLIILLGAELFTNGIEWFGRKLGLAEGAVGSVLAAVGTALPETLIPIIAILAGGGSEASHAIGVGAILGAPFMLATLAMFVTGVAVLYVAPAAPDRRRHAGRHRRSSPTTCATSRSRTRSRSAPRSCRSTRSGRSGSSRWS